MRAVFDTNVLVAAFLTEGVCSKLLVRARRRDCDLILSLHILGEVENVLAKKFSLSPSEVSEVHTLLTEAAKELVRQVDPIPPLRGDPDDDKVIACAQAARADYLVTGDQDLLVIRKHGKTEIVTPRDFEARFPD